MEFIIGLVIGFGIGWLLFKRPDKMSELIAWVKSKIGFGS